MQTGKSTIFSLGSYDVSLPEGWQLLPVKDLLVVTQYGTNTAVHEQGNVPVIGMKNLAHGKVNTAGLSKVLLKEEEEKKYLLKKGDILINRTNSYELVGKVGVFDSEQNSVFASYLVRLRVNHRIDPWFLNYCLNTFQAQKTIKRLATKAISQANINPTEFKKHCYIPVPPYEEGVKIARILKLAEDEYFQTQNLIAAKIKLKQGLMQSLLTGRKRLSGYSKPWQEFKLGTLFSQRKETGNSHLPLIAITGKAGIMDRDSLNRKDTSSADKSKYLRICPGDIGYNTMRMWQGVSAFSDREGIISPAYTVCTPNPGIHGQFMAYLFKDIRVIHRFYRYSQGLTSDTWNLKFPHFSQVKVFIPTEENEQKAIVSLFQEMDREIDQLNQQLTLLKTQKRGLMQKLLTGQWRLPTAVQQTIPNIKEPVTEQ